MTIGIEKRCATKFRSIVILIVTRDNINQYCSDKNINGC